ncbi:hypothetical protein GCM10009838_01910 [Catenulispora subtropica]|uniref:Uncharacterized protein n=1 Tax=Catenulispora subtropica TaxID=450798 RepID=A0ABN2QDV4_9ACTN
MQIAAVEQQRPRRRWAEGVGDRPGVDGTVGEGHGLPGGVPAEDRAAGVLGAAETAAGPPARRDVGSTAGPGDDEALGGEKRYRARDRHRAHAVLPHQIAAAGQPIADREPRYQGTQPTRERRGNAIVRHEE